MSTCALSGVPATLQRMLAVPAVPSGAAAPPAPIARCNASPRCPLPRPAAPSPWARRCQASSRCLLSCPFAPTGCASLCKQTSSCLPAAKQASACSAELAQAGAASGAAALARPRTPAMWRRCRCPVHPHPPRCVLQQRTHSTSPVCVAAADTSLHFAASSPAAQDSDSPWNELLRSEVPALFLQSLEEFKALPPPEGASHAGPVMLHAHALTHAALHSIARMHA